MFRVLDYLSRWVQEKQTKKGSRGYDPMDIADQIQRVDIVLSMIPPEIISQRAVECKSYSRALFYWEQHIRDCRERKISEDKNTELLERLQDIYTQIDEPDGIEGISAHLHVLDIEQQILGHRKAGRWTAAQSWYEIKLAETPDDVDVQVNLLTCLKESGQHGVLCDTLEVDDLTDSSTDVLLNYIEGMQTTPATAPRLLPFATEASWATGRWLALKKYTSMESKGASEDFNVRIGHALLALHSDDPSLFQSTICSIREQIARSLSTATTASLATCHDNMLKLHVLTELEMIAGTDNGGVVDRPKVLESLNRRLEVIGAYLNDKQYLLGIRRAAMQLSRYATLPLLKAGLLMYTALLLRKVTLLPHGLLVLDSQERETPSINPSTLFFTHPSLKTTLQPSSMHDFYGRKATTERPSKISKEQSRTMHLYLITEILRISALLLPTPQNNKIFSRQERICFLPSG